VKKSVTGAIGGSAAAVGLATLAELLRLSSKSTLVAAEIRQLPDSTIFHLTSRYPPQARG